MSQKKNLYIDQGTDYSTTIQVLEDNTDPKDLTGYTCFAQMRKHYLSSNSVVFNTTVSNGQVIISLDPSDTIGLDAGRYVYDVELISSSNVVSRLVEGTVILNPEVTK